MIDYYLDDPTRLNGQPKRTIADYVESKGILVPKIFDSFNEAKASGLPIIARSEHYQDYAGASGILNSPDLNDEDYVAILHEEELKEKVFNATFFQKVLCSYMNLDLSKFQEEFSFSYWEKIEGANRMIVADSAIKGRYHITTRKKNIRNHTIVENGKIVIQGGYPNLPKQFVNGLDKLIELYETIRNFDNFNPNHCPIMEFQTRGNKNYFLQYHRTRDFEPTTFVLDRPKQNDEIEAYFTRGKTSPEGIVVKATVVYNDWCLLKPYVDWILPEEEASFDINYNHVFWEVMSRRRKVQFMNAHSLNYSLAEIAVQHKSRSHTFKPEVSIILPKDSLFDEEEYDKMYKNNKKTKKNQEINVHVISDGRRALVKRV